MPISDAKRRANEKWNAKNMVKIGCIVSHSVRDQFKEACESQGDTMYSALRSFVDDYIAKYKKENQ